MKKILLSLLIFCSVISQAQIQIPQVVGLPSALNSKVDKVTGKSLVADTSIIKLNGIQSGAQVNKLEGIQKNGVDLPITGKKVNITVPTTATEIGAQPAGAYATGTGTAYNSNNGDETLTSIKTKLGAATAVSDGYLKYQDFVNFDGKLSSEVDGSVTNELQTISTNGAAGNIALSNSGGTLNLNVNDADASPTNEIQDLSLSGNTLSLSSDATTVDISQATAVLANTAKVSNATHTGDVTGSTALTLKTVNSNVGTFNNITINAKGLATAGSNVSYEPSFPKNTGFNKNFGTTPGTVLEGRTFGTAANSSVGDFIQNQNSIPQISNMWVKGLVTAQSVSGSFIPLRVFGDFNVSGKYYGSLLIGKAEDSNQSAQVGWMYDSLTPSNSFFHVTPYGMLEGSAFKMLLSGASTFSSTVNSTGFLLNGNNLTSSLSTNYIPKWNGSSFVNATAGTDYQLPITITTNGTSGAATFSGNVLNVPNYSSTGTGGTYPCPPTNVTNLTSSSIGMSIYTKTGSVYSVSISGVIDPTAAGTCVIRLPMPTNISGGVVPMCYSSSNFTTPQGWSVSAGSNYIDLSINTNGSDCQFYANITYVY